MVSLEFRCVKVVVMKVSEFIKKNQTVVVIGSLLVLGVSVLMAIRSITRTPSSQNVPDQALIEDMMKLPAQQGEGVFVPEPTALQTPPRRKETVSAPEPEPTTPQIPLLSNIILIAIITPLLLGGWFLVRKFAGLSKQGPQENEEDRRRKNDLKKIQETLELYYRLRQRYPEAGDEFREIVKDLKPPLEGSVTDYHYENPESDTQRYRLWCFLEDKNDPEAKEGLYELASDKTAA